MTAPRRRTSSRSIRSLGVAKLVFGERHVLIQLIQTCVAAAGAVLLYQLTMQLTSSRRAAAWAGALFAMHPLLIRQASAAAISR